MFVTSYSVTNCIYVHEKLRFVYRYYCAVFDECKYSDTFWLADRTRLFVQYTISLSLLCKLIWRHWTYKMPPRYILSSVWVRLSIFSQLSTLHYNPHSNELRSLLKLVTTKWLRSIPTSMSTLKLGKFWFLRMIWSCRSRSIKPKLIGILSQVFAPFVPIECLTSSTSLWVFAGTMGMTYTPTNADTDRRRQGQYPKAKTGFVSKFTPHLVIFGEISENVSNPWNCFIYLRLYRKRTANVLFLVVPRCIRFILDVAQYWYETHIGYIYFGKFQRSPQALWQITWSLSYTFKNTCCDLHPSFV